MNEEIIRSLENDDKYTKIYLINIFNFLSTLKEYENLGSNADIIEGLYQEFFFKELLDNKWGKKYIAEDTRLLGLAFHISWKRYIYDKPFGEDIFAYFDKDWYEIIINKLIPFIRALNRDLDENDILEDITEGSTLKRIQFSGIVNFDKRPPDADILLKAENLYRLLLEKKIIQKPYMGED